MTRLPIDELTAAVALSADGHRLCVADLGDETLAIFPGAQAAPSSVMDATGRLITRVALSTRGRHIAWAQSGGVGLAEETLDQPGLIPLGGRILFLCFHPTDAYVAVAQEEAVRLFSWGTRQPVGGFICPSEPTALAFSHCGSLVAAATEGGAVAVWDLSGPAPVAALSTSLPADALALSVSRQGLVAVLTDGQVVQKSTGGESRATALPVESSIVCAAFNPTGESVVLATDQELLVWTIRTDILAQNWRDIGSITRLCLPGDGRVVALEDGQLKTRDWDETVAVVQEHDPVVLSPGPALWNARAQPPGVQGLAATYYDRIGDGLPEPLRIRVAQAMAFVTEHQTAEQLDLPLPASPGIALADHELAAVAQAMGAEWAQHLRSVAQP